MHKNMKIEKIFPEEVYVKCEKKIAYDSNDHLFPKGSKEDNSKNSRFNYKFYRSYGPIFLRILDLGCAGGKFVRECINNGCFAIGLEGSDYSKKMQRAEWPIIPKSLYTCDITRNFYITHKKKKQPIKFHLITAWEVLEHIEEKDINSLIKNIKEHLLENGLFIASVANYSDKVRNVEYHKTQKDKNWWIKEFTKHGFFLNKELYKYFNGHYIRGASENNKSFHLIMGLNPEKTPKPRKLNIKERIIDRWMRSRIKIILYRYLIK
jgi:2-polyprenyl-3-methyl-5-hydroxy-6-metoxy-1,4-benzoquinol methylase